MNSFFERLNNLAYSIAKDISRKDYQVINLCGPSGTGKTWMLKSIASALSDQHENGIAVIRLHGDVGAKTIHYAPFIQFLNNKKRWKKGVGSLVEGIPYFGPGIRYIVETKDLRHLGVSAKQINDNELLSRYPLFTRELLFLNKKYNHVVLLCDDIHHFDEASISYLQGIVPFFNHGSSLSISIVASYNTSTFDGDPLVFSSQRSKRVDLQYPSIEEVSFILRDWNPDYLCTKESLDAVYAATNGHLALLNQVSLYYLQDNKGLVTSDDNNNVFLRGLLEKRAQETDSGDKILRLLEALAAIGRSASIAELKCTLNDMECINRVINDAVELKLLYKNSVNVSFLNDSIRELSQWHSRLKNKEFFALYARCLKKLMPSEYEKRAIVEELAGNHTQSQVLAGLHVIKLIRAGRVPDRMIDQPDVASVVNGLYEAYRLSFAGENEVALKLIKELRDCSHFPMLEIEIKYAEYTFLFKSNLIENRSEALSSLIGIIDICDMDEVEIWSRLMRLRIAFDSSLGNLDNAQFCYKEYQNKLLSRISYDKSVNEVLFECGLMADSFYEPDVSHTILIGIQREVEREVLRENLEYVPLYYRSSINLSSNEIVCGMLQDARIMALKAINIAQKYDFILFPNAGAAYNNYLLAIYFLKSEPIEIITQEYAIVVNSLQYDEDSILLRLNYVGLLLQAGNNKDALFEIDHISQAAIDAMDTYYAYYYYFNKALTLYFSGRLELARSVMDKICDMTKNCSFTRQRYYQKHYTITRQLMLEESPYSSLQSMQESFARVLPEYLSNNWKYFMSVYLFSDLQIWTQF